MNDPTNQQNPNTAQLKPSWQTMVALLFFIGTIVSLLMYRYGTTHDFSNYDNTDDFADWEEKTKAMNIALYTFWRNCELFQFLILLIGYSLLYKLASNRSARLFIVLSVIGNIIGMVFTFVYYQHFIGHFDSGSPISDTLMTVVSIAWIVSELCCIYAFSVLLGDQCLSAKSKSWIGILLLRWVMVLSIAVANLVTGGLQKLFSETMATATSDDSQLSTFDYFQHSGLYPAFWQILTILVAFALWHMARSEAFSKSYDATQPPRLSPVNKWMAAAAVCAVIVTVGLYLLYTTVMSECFITVK